MKSKSGKRHWNSAVALSAAVVIAVVTARYAAADPIVGRDLIKFSQLPMLNTSVQDDSGFNRGFHGHDELSTAWSSYRGGTAGVPLQFTGYRGTVMTDDFADTLSSPVVHVKWWGSYLNGPLDGVEKFLITFGRGFDGHGELDAQLSQVVVKGAISTGSGTFTEQQVYPLSVDGPIYEYNAELYLGKEFQQLPNRRYSLSIAALVDVGPNQNPLTDPSVVRWGWHTRDYTQSNPYAANVSSVVSDRVHGVIAPSTNVWHFGEGSEPGDFQVRAGIGGFLMPNVEGLQTASGPQRYRPTPDGPLAIGQFLRDQAFVLYSVPEPSACLLMVTAFCGLSIRRRSWPAARSILG